MNFNTPAPKPLDADRLAEIRRFIVKDWETIEGDVYLASKALQDLDALSGHIAYRDQQLAQAAEREGRYAELVEAATELLGNWRCFFGRSFEPEGSVPVRLDKALAALAPTEKNDAENK